MHGTFRLLYVEPVGGVAGDMLLGALLDLGADVATLRRAFHSLAIDGLALDVDEIRVDEERALHVRSLAPRRLRAAHLEDIVALLRRADAPAAAIARAERVFGILCDAEGEVHGESSADVHLHEVGEVDSVLDVLGIAVALNLLGSPSVVCGALPSGRGEVETAHGVLACPVPAVRAIARRFAIPLVDIAVTGETITPTGVAVLAEAARFGESPEPRSGAAAVGVGAGTRRFADRTNVVRVYGWR